MSTRAILPLLLLGLSLGFASCDSSSVDGDFSSEYDQYLVFGSNVIAGTSRFTGTTTLFYETGSQVFEHDETRHGVNSPGTHMRAVISEAGARGVRIDWEVHQGRVRLYVLRGMETPDGHEGDVILDIEANAGETLTFTHGQVD